MCKRKSYVVSAAIVMTIAAMMLFPVIGIAGSLEPSAAPAPTMKTLDEIPPAWSQKLPGAQRFELVLDGVAVLDKETGLVWEQSPSIATNDWGFAFGQCASLEVGGRKGWHLPTIEQLTSLIDLSVSTSPKLPAGHPFTAVGTSATYYFWSATTYYAWSATTNAPDTTFASVVRFGDGLVGGYVKIDAYNHVWCVRGGQSYDYH